MKRVFLCCALAAAVLGLTGCASFHNVSNKIDATGMDFTTAKKGTDCTYALLGIIPLSTDDIDAAAKKANITSLGFVEYTYTHYVLFSKTCTVVYGK